MHWCKITKPYGDGMLVKVFELNHHLLFQKFNATEYLRRSFISSRGY